MELFCLVVQDGFKCEGMGIYAYTMHNEDRHIFPQISEIPLFGSPVILL